MSARTEFLKNCVVLDTETTSKSYNDAEIVEFGFVLYDNSHPLHWIENGELYKPMEPMVPECMAVTNISNKMLEDKPYFGNEKSYVTDLLAAFDGQDICIAHNALYDRKVLSNYGIEPERWLCTLAMAKKLWHNDETYQAFNLPYLRFRRGILDPADFQGIAHRASFDALVTSTLLEQMLDIMEESGILEPDVSYYDQITAWLEEPIIYTTMPFGKHKGKLLTEVPVGYWNWALDNLDSLNETSDNYDRNFAASVAAAFEAM